MLATDLQQRLRLPTLADVDLLAWRFAFISEHARRFAAALASRRCASLAGHSKLEMTQRNADANAADLRSAMKKLEE